MHGVVIRSRWHPALATCREVHAKEIPQAKAFHMVPPYLKAIVSIGLCLNGSLEQLAIVVVAAQGNGLPEIEGSTTTVTGHMQGAVMKAIITSHGGLRGCCANLQCNQGIDHFER